MLKVNDLPQSDVFDSHLKKKGTFSMKGILCVHQRRQDEEEEEEKKGEQRKSLLQGTETP